MESRALLRRVEVPRLFEDALLARLFDEDDADRAKLFEDRAGLGVRSMISLISGESLPSASEVAAAAATFFGLPSVLPLGVPALLSANDIGPSETERGRIGRLGLGGMSIEVTRDRRTSL